MLEEIGRFVLADYLRLSAPSKIEFSRHVWPVHGLAHPLLVLPATRVELACAFAVAPRPLLRAARPRPAARRNLPCSLKLPLR